MAKALIIAEKPSVANDLAKALGGFSKKGDYQESEQYVLSSAIGHLLELREPPASGQPGRKWSLERLPVIPDHFDLVPIDKTEGRLKLLVQLIKRKDVESLINACDAGREGELIFRRIVQFAGARKPVRRLWLQSLTPQAIRDGFQALRTDAAMRPLANAAVCRSEADWLVGINGTRGMTAYNSKSGGFTLTTVGRVQTPTLAIVVEREERILQFKPRDYWEVHGAFAAQAGEYIGRWFDEKFAKGKNGDPDLRAERLWELSKAEAIRAKCLGQPGVVTEETKPSTQLPPLLYDLTSLQREANSRFGFAARATLQVAQTLYEKHKAITYPRTDSRALPEDYVATAQQTLAALAGTAYGQFASQILQRSWVQPNKRIFNNAKVTDHFALVPTPLPPKHLTEAEAKIYDMIVRRFLAVFYPAAEFLGTVRITRVEGEPFKSEGKVVVNPGWMAVYGREAQPEDVVRLVPVRSGETVNTSDVRVVAAQTKPPPRFTDATLLSAMEGAGKLIEDDELREAMSAKGLGTPATRAAIIEGLLQELYLRRQGRELQPTQKAFFLLELLRHMQISELSSPELTGDWEFKLKQMERGQLSRKEFMGQIEEMTRQLVERVKQSPDRPALAPFAVLKVKCPKCGAGVQEDLRRFHCEKCDFAIWKRMPGRLLQASEVEELIAKRTVGPLQGFLSRQKRRFAAVLRLTEQFKVEFDFARNGNGDKPAAATPDFSGQEPLGACPRCGSRVFDNDLNYACEKAVGLQPGCAFRLSKVILKRPLDRAQVQKLLAEGKTDLLDNFISKRGRPFAAYLARTESGEVKFEFEKRAPAGKPAGPKEREAKPAGAEQRPGEPVGQCPLCGAKVLETRTTYECEKRNDKTTPCKFRVGRLILQQPIDRAQLARLLSDKRTELLSGFVSKFGRPFPAYLVLSRDGRVGFEFPDRANPD